MIIKIKNLRLTPIIGVYKHERLESQEIIINLELEYNATKAMQSDNLEDALDYDIIKSQIKELVDDTRFRLLERMADHLLTAILTFHKGIKRATIEIDKPGALKEADSVSFTLSKKS